MTSDSPSEAFLSACLDCGCITVYRDWRRLETPSWRRFQSITISTVNFSAIKHFELVLRFSADSFTALFLHLRSLNWKTPTPLTAC